MGDRLKTFHKNVDFEATIEVILIYLDFRLLKKWHWLLIEKSKKNLNLPIIDFTIKTKALLQKTFKSKLIYGTTDIAPKTISEEASRRKHYISLSVAKSQFTWREMMWNIVLKRLAVKFVSNFRFGHLWYNRLLPPPSRTFWTSICGSGNKSAYKILLFPWINNAVTWPSKFQRIKGYWFEGNMSTTFIEPCPCYASRILFLPSLIYSLNFRLKREFLTKQTWWI